MSCDSASANRVAEEVYPTLWCWISFLLIESSTYNNANSIPRIRDGAMRSGWTDTYWSVCTYRSEGRLLGVLDGLRSHTEPRTLRRDSYDNDTNTSCIILHFGRSAVLGYYSCCLVYISSIVTALDGLRSQALLSIPTSTKTHDLNYPSSRSLHYEPTIWTTP